MKGVAIVENKIGIDAGGSLIKMVYYESGHYHFKKYNINEMHRLVNWLNIVNKHGTTFLTGGKAKQLSEKLSHKRYLVDEFHAMAVGSKCLLEELGERIEDYILISIGTGTSIYYVSSDSFERLTGTGLGGGTFIGLGTILAHTSSYHFLIDCAKKGEASKVDLLVKDIYEYTQISINGDLTAANFGKIDHSNIPQIEDQVAALLQMIAENIMLLAIHMANIKNVKHLVFVGGMLEGNETFQQILASFAKSVDLKPIFLEKGIFTGALGALKIND
jgi:type II pantothenate kinase